MPVLKVPFTGIEFALCETFACPELLFSSISRHIKRIDSLPAVNRRKVVADMVRVLSKQ
jgi:hypothetical protein